MSPSCEVCADVMEPAGTGREAEHGTVRGTLEGAAAWRCPAGHGSLAADVDAGRQEVRAALDVAERTRFRNTLRCASCHTPYALPGRRATRSVTLVATGLPATTLTLDVPVLRCTEDAIESLPPECVDDLEAVVGDLLRGPA